MHGRAKSCSPRTGSGLRRSPMEAIERVRQRLTAMLATHLNPRLSDWTSAASKPTTFEATRSTPLASSCSSSSNIGLRLCTTPVPRILDPDFAMAKLDAAIAYMNLGEFSRRTPLGEWWARRRAGTAPFDRYWLRWMQAHLRGDRVGALQAVRQAARAHAGF